MNMTRILILVGALGAAGLAAFLARGLMGGQNSAEAAPAMQLTEIMVASRALEVGTKIMPGDLKWMGWPKSALDPSFITKESQPQALEDAAEGSVARMPLGAGEPVTVQKVIKADGAGFLAAVLTPGRRAVGIKLSPERSAAFRRLRCPQSFGTFACWRSIRCRRRKATPNRSWARRRR
jgi:pilus assembly protein CpaB